MYNYTILYYFSGHQAIKHRLRLDVLYGSVTSGSAYPVASQRGRDRAVPVNQRASSGPEFTASMGSLPRGKPKNKGFQVKPKRKTIARGTRGPCLQVGQNEVILGPDRVAFLGAIQEVIHVHIPGVIQGVSPGVEVGVIHQVTMEVEGVILEVTLVAGVGVILHLWVEVAVEVEVTPLVGLTGVKVKALVLKRVERNLPKQPKGVKRARCPKMEKGNFPKTKTPKCQRIKRRKEV